MERSKASRRPSPALVISILALIVAVGGGTLAFAALNKAKVKRIATQVVNAKASSLSVNHATTADTANTAGTATVGGPVAYALVNADGTVNSAHSRGITSANITRVPLASFCFRNLPPFRFANVTAAWEQNATSPSKSVELGFPDGPNEALVNNDCGSGVQVEVVTQQGALNDFAGGSGFGFHAFFISLYN